MAGLQDQQCLVQLESCIQDSLAAPSNDNTLGLKPSNFGDSPETVSKATFLLWL